MTTLPRSAIWSAFLSLVLWDTCQQCGGFGVVWHFDGWFVPWCKSCDRCGCLGIAEPERWEQWECCEDD